MVDIIEGTFEGKHIEILFEGNDRPCSMTVNFVRPHPLAGELKRDDVFQNPVKLSAFLASEIGYGPACDLLHANNVPRESQLWHLNHAGWSPPQAIDSRRPGWL